MVYIKRPIKIVMPSEEQFYEAVDRHPANAFVRFIYRNVLAKNRPNYLLVAAFFVFIIGLVAKITMNGIFDIGTLVLSAILFVVFASALAAKIMNNSRIGKICRELNITRYQFNMYAKLFKNENNV